MEVKFMEKLLINTAQNVQIEYKLASVGSRFLALAIDYGIMVCYGYLCYFIIDAVFFTTKDFWTIEGALMFLLLPIFLYHFLLESFFNGQTPGKKLMKIKVVRLDGSRASIYDYFIRWSLNLVDIWLLGGVIGFISIILSQNSQRVGDRAAGTTVINLKPRLKLHETVYEDLYSAYQPVFSEFEINKLTDRDINIIKQSFQKGKKSQSMEVMQVLTAKIQEVTGIKDQETHPASFIETVLKDHFHYNSHD